MTFFWLGSTVLYLDLSKNVQYYQIQNVYELRALASQLKIGLLIRNQASDLPKEKMDTGVTVFI